MTDNQPKPPSPAKIHSVTYIAAIRDYLLLRTEVDNISHEEQIHLAHLVFRVKMDGSSSVGYRELQKLRLSPKTISKNNKKFRERGIISKVNVGHSNQYGDSGKVSKYHFDLLTILRLNAEVADFPQGEDATAKSADFPKWSADFPKGVELLPSRGSIPEVLYPEKAILKDQPGVDFSTNKSKDSNTAIPIRPLGRPSVAGAEPNSENETKISTLRQEIKLFGQDYRRIHRGEMLYRENFEAELKSLLAAQPTQSEQGRA